jgi:hypothetical protein
LREKVAAKPPDEGFLFVEPTPHPAEFVAGVGEALSRKGRGRINGHFVMDSRKKRECRSTTMS